MIIDLAPLCIESLSTGMLSVRRISFQDWDFLQSQVNDKQIPDLAFLQNVLANQVCEHALNPAQLGVLNKHEVLDLGKQYLLKEEALSELYLDSGNIEKDFRRTVSVYVEDIRKRFEQAIAPLRDSFKQMDLQFGGVTIPAIGMPSPFLKISEEIKKISDRVTSPLLDSLSSIQEVIAPLQNISHSFQDTLLPAINAWSIWSKQHQDIYQDLAKTFKSLASDYKLHEDEVVETLGKYKWFITPGLPIALIVQVVSISRTKGRRDKDVNALFVNHFSDNNWEEIQLMVNSWNTNVFPERRLKIIRDIASSLRTMPSSLNAANIVLPTLISQIDGMLSDYLKFKNLTWQVEYDDWVQGGKIRKLGRKSVFKHNYQKVLGTKPDELANTILLNILFQSSQKGSPLKTPFNFNRHKILHGEITTYGKKAYLVRAFMIMDFLAHLR